ncbi:MAG: hypothetical protein V8T62_10350 [Oscillospiraceae bacterium]
MSRYHSVSGCTTSMPPLNITVIRSFASTTILTLPDTRQTGWHT